MCVLVTQFPTISLLHFFPLFLSVCVLQSLFPLVPLCKHAVLSLFISFSSNRQGQRVLSKYFKLNSTLLSECFFWGSLSNIGFFVHLNISSRKIIVSFLFICILVFAITVQASSVLRVHWEFIGLCTKCSFTSICCIFVRWQSYIDVTKLSPPQFYVLLFMTEHRYTASLLTPNQELVALSMSPCLLPPLLPSPVTLAYQCRAAVCEEIPNI